MKSQLKIGAALSYFNVALSTVIGLIVSPILIHGLGDSQYGAYQMTTALIGYMSVLDLGLHSSITRYVSRYQATKEKKKEENFLAVSLLMFSVVALIILIISAIIYFNLGSIYSSSVTPEELALIKKLMIILAIDISISMPGAVFGSIIIAYERFAFSKVLTSIKMITRFVMVIVLIKFNAGAIAIAMLDFTLNMSIILINFIFCFKKLNVRIHLYNASGEYVKGILSFSIFIFIVAITEQINWKVDTTILGILIGTTAVTLYNVSGNLIGSFRSFSGAVSGIFLPRAVKMVSNGADNKSLTDLMIRVGRIQMMILGLVLAGFAVIGKDFISLWVGERFTECYYWFFIVSIPSIVPLTQSLGINILEAKFMHQFRAIVYFFIAMANVILSVILVKMFGIIGAPIGTGVTLFIGANVVINWYYSARVHLEIKRFFKEVYLRLIPLQILIAVVAYFATSFVSIGNGWIQLIVKGVVICVIYAAVMLLCGLNKKEKKDVTGVLKPVLKAFKRT